jgi:DNA ligase (NAD+)
MRDKEFLVKEIKRLANLYYSGVEEVDDKTYDLLIEELRAIDPENELIAGMASDETNAAGYKKMNHNLITGTLRKAMELNEFEKWVCSHKGSYHCSEKLDGQGFELVYENGVLTHLVSRGDGYTGFDKITLAKYLNIPHTLPQKGNVSVRGEFELSNNGFRTFDIFKEMKNPRNAGAGLLNKKAEDLTDEEIKAMGEIHFFAYDAIGLDVKTKSDLFQKLEELGFKVPKNKVCNSYEEVVEFRSELAKVRGTDEENFAIDGVVVFENLLDAEDQKEKVQKKAIAIKFELEIGIGEILDIEWSLSGSYLTPVAIMTPMELAGVVVERANLCNLNNIQKLGIKIGDKVKVMRRGEVIPRVMSKA